METAKLVKTSLSKDSVRLTPKEPGIYIFWDNKDVPLYVGKSISLRSRLSSYLNFPLEPKTKTMISQAVSFSIIRVGSELEALLLEAKLIRTLNPHYNIELKDDKHPLYIRITKEDFPRVLTARKVDIELGGKSKNLAVYGPFPSSRNVKSVLKMLRKTFPFAQHEPGDRPCIYSQIGLCEPCPNFIVNLKDDEVLRKRLKKQYKKNIKFLKSILDGKIEGVRGSLEIQMKGLSKKMLFEEAGKLKEKIGRLDYITQPITNPYEFIKNPNLLSDIRNSEVKTLAEFLRSVIPEVKPLKRIECFDVAHLAGTKPTASMVTFIGGEPNKNLYRRFGIRQRKGNDDYASLAEVAKRRVKHLGDWGGPDLVVVDGGKGQVQAFCSEFAGLDIPVVGLAKRFETLVVPVVGTRKKFWELRVPNGPALNLLQRLRDESHRFARSYHHKLIEKGLLD